MLKQFDPKAPSTGYKEKLMRHRTRQFAMVAICVGGVLASNGSSSAQKAQPPAPSAAQDIKSSAPTPKTKEIATTPLTADDCPPATKYENAADNSVRYCLFAEQKSLKRCETSYFNYIKRDANTAVSFSFRLEDSNWDFHDIFTSIFQIHSKPDPGEAWRCPIAMLAVQDHTLVMWDRYDLSPISTTSNGTCADEGNSIHGQDVFSGIPVQAGRWYDFALHADLTLKPSGTFTATLDNETIGSVSGPNTYNDQHEPFAKIGIYKPSPWQNAKRLCVDYRNVRVNGGN